MCGSVDWGLLLKSYVKNKGESADVFVDIVKSVMKFFEHQSYRIFAERYEILWNPI